MTTNPNNLGRLEKVDLREVRASEAGDFTPWLATEENIVLLGDTIGVDLEVEAQEKDVGPFRADILCKDTGTDHWVLIENQLERTDHSHLGQLITYAAGLNAVTIVWIAERFTEEHRAALDWLNEATGDELRAELEMFDEKSKLYYAQLVSQKPDIEKELGQPLTWYNPENRKTCRIYIRMGTSVDLHCRESWPTYHEWLMVKLDALRSVFAQRVKQLDADAVAIEGNGAEQ